MACISWVDFSMNNPELQRELKKIGVNFNDDFTECVLASGEKYEFIFENYYSVPYIGFGREYMLSMYFEYFLGCGTPQFVYKFMQIMTENGYFESEYDFVNGSFAQCEEYDESFYDNFKLSSKLLAFEKTIIEAVVETYESNDGDVNAFKATVEKDIMNMYEFYLPLYDFMEDIEDFKEPSPDEGFDYWWYDFEEEDQKEMTITKNLVDGKWIEN